MSSDSVPTITNNPLTAPTLFDRSINDPDLEIHLFSDSLFKSRQKGDLYNQAVDLYKLGFAYFKKNILALAKDCFEESVGIIEELNRRHLLIFPKSGLGLCYEEEQNYDHALLNYIEALSICRDVNHSSEISLLIRIGGLYSQIGEYTDAILYFAEALMIARQSSELDTQASLLNYIATAYFSLGDLQLAIEHFKESLNIYYRLGNDEDYADVLFNLAVCLSETGEMASAIVLATQAQAILSDKSTDSVLTIDLKLNQWRAAFNK